MNLRALGRTVSSARAASIAFVVATAALTPGGAASADEAPYPVTLLEIDSDSALKRDERPPEVDREALFRRFAADFPDPDGVKDVYMGKVFGQRINLFLPVWMVCVSYNRKGGAGGYQGRVFKVLAMPEDRPDLPFRVYAERDGEIFYRNCSPFRRAVKDQ